MCSMCDISDPKLEERVIEYWEEYKTKVPSHSIEEMMKFFNLAKGEAEEILEKHPEFT